MPLDYKGFEEKYNLGSAFEQMFTMQNKFRQLDAFQFDIRDSATSRKQYIKGFSYMLARKLESHTQLNAMEKMVQLIPFRLPQFIRDYEEAVNTEFYRKNPNGKRHPYEGTQIQILNIAAEQAKAYNKSLIDIWADHVRDRVSLTSIRKFTSGTDEKSTKATIVMRYAMRDVIYNRAISWYFNPLNWNRWRKENAYMRELDKKFLALDYTTQVEPLLDSLQNRALSTSATQEIVKLRDEKTKELQAKLEAKNNAKKKVNEEENVKNDEAINADDNHILNPIVNKAVEIKYAPLPKKKNAIEDKTRALDYFKNAIEKEGFKEEMQLQMADYLEKFAPSLQENGANGVAGELYEFMLEGSRQVCEAYDRCKDENAGDYAIEEHLERTTNNLYKIAYEYLSTVIGEGDNKLVIAQAVTDLFMNKVTPVAFNPEEYSDFGDNFSTRHDEFSAKVIAQSEFVKPEKAKEMLEEAMKDLRKLNKVSFKDTDLNSFSNQPNSKEDVQMFINSNNKNNIIAEDDRQLSKNDENSLIHN